MGLWRATDVATTPEIELINWSVYEVSSKLWPEKTRHFVGYNITEREGRVSSAIQKFDQNYMVGITNSGRSYSLKGAPGSDGDANYVFVAWCSRNNIDDLKDVTSEYVTFPEEGV